MTATDQMKHAQAIEAAMLAGPRDMFVRRGDVYHRASISSEDVECILQAYQSALPSAQPAAQPVAVPHPDDDAVDRFAAAMKAKLAKKRAEGVTGWDDPEQCHIDYLTHLLREQIHSRAVFDPIDIGNFAMMLHNRPETPSHGR